MTSVQHYTIPRVNRIFKSNSISNRSLLMSKNLPTSTPLPTTQLSSFVDKFEVLSEKRARPISPLNSCKKGKVSKKPVWKLMICLYDEDVKSSVNFRCFCEESMIPKEVSQQTIVPCQNDDDCKTQEEEIQFCSEYLAFQLQHCIIKAECSV